MGGLGKNRQMKKPLVSVILPVHNGRAFLKESIETILNQSYTNLELIIINDGSIDGSERIISLFSDSRIRYFYQKNKGLAKTLNIGILLSRGQYIARQDQDDFSEFKRIEKQVNFLLKHPNIGMVGCNARIWKNTKKTNFSTNLPLTSGQLKIAMLFDNYFIHSSLLIKKTVFNKIGLYSEDRERQPPEDYELWSKLIRKFDAANMKENLVNYRKTKQSMSQNGGAYYKKIIIQLSIENIIFIIGNSNKISEVEDLVNLFHKNYECFSDRNLNLNSLMKMLENIIKISVTKHSLNDKDVNFMRKTLTTKLRLCYLDYQCKGLLCLIKKAFT